MGWIMTRLGWKQLRPRTNNIGIPPRAKPLATTGFQDPADYDDQGRYLLDPKVWQPGELEAFRAALASAKSMGGKDYFPGDPAKEKRERGHRNDKWGVRVMS